METLVETLNNIQPVIIFAMLMILWVIESFIPYLAPSPNRKKHGLRNFVILLISFVFNGLSGLYIGEVVRFTTEHQLGLLNVIHLPFVVSFIAGMLMIDLWDYGYHILTHKVNLLWRYHRVHHSDTELDSTSSLRFHPLEIIMQSLSWTIMFPLLGISAASFVVYFTFLIWLIFLQHANIKLPDWIDKYGCYVFSTPGWHKMHHAAERRITDSHYGDVFTFWDRIFGTGGPIDVEHIQFGIEHFRDDTDQTVKNILLMPFKPIHPGTGRSEHRVSTNSDKKLFQRDSPVSGS